MSEKVAEECLIHLDVDGELIPGDMADHYELKKTYGKIQIK
jgi:hypothetical protein